MNQLKFKDMAIGDACLTTCGAIITRTSLDYLTVTTGSQEYDKDHVYSIRGNGSYLVEEYGRKYIPNKETSFNKLYNTLKWGELD